MQALLKLPLSGIHVVADSFLAPSHDFLRTVCREKGGGGHVTVLSLDVPRHRLEWVGATHCLDLYGITSIRDLLKTAEEETWNDRETIVIVDSVTRFLEYDGVAVVLDTVLQLKAKAKCLLVTVHEDLISRAALDQLVAACSNGGLVRLGPERNVIEIVAKRKGGKVARSLEAVQDWSGLVVKNLSPSLGPERKELALEDTNKEEKERLALPFVKTAVAGKMIFDVEDMKQGDYEEDADKSSEDEEDVDSDLNF
jgi:hypothetical protein